MKAITTIFESILRDNNNLVWSPDDATGHGVARRQGWDWGG